MHRTTYVGVGLQILEDAGVRDFVEFYAEESQVVLPRLLGEGRRFDFAFIDGNHRFEGVFLDLIYCGRLVEEGATVFVDDTQLPGVRHAVDFCVANLGWVAEERGQEGMHEWLVPPAGKPIDASPLYEAVQPSLAAAANQPLIGVRKALNQPASHRDGLVAACPPRRSRSGTRTRLLGHGRGG
jgi:Methyltransferase domain